jgi:hypothetical protein
MRLRGHSLTVTKISARICAWAMLPLFSISGLRGEAAGSDVVSAGEGISLCYSEGLGEFLSIDQRGRLLLLQKEGGTDGESMRLSTRMLSAAEIENLGEFARNLTEIYRPFVSRDGSPVISISEVADEPPGFRVAKGMAALRIWISGETWEFYAKRSGTGHWRGFEAMASKLREICEAEVLSSYQDQAGSVLIVVEEPRGFFIPNLHESALGKSSTSYLCREFETPNDGGLDVLWGGEVLPGMMEVVDLQKYKNIKAIPGLKDRAGFVTYLISKGITIGEPVTMDEEERARSCIRATFSTMIIQP